MKRWLCGLVLSGFLSDLMGQTPSVNQTESSPTGYVLIGILLLAIVIFILYRRQKRKFND
ncbi:MULTISPECIES: LPXTG cell wall anchor domain-containing protein [Sphingobacterium]|uniref:LPXTG cell wall anchor domain-containing protein n=1 Tax=Sphingobacterium populi TaxID=1812824 RepID=A0ABW5UGW8_9SPHI|nr:LPXTG cell wall anchor domain-containing protein [Sphingobacterium sp. CFCC 11742]